MAPKGIGRTKRSVAAVFAVNGFALGSLLSRAPGIKSGLDLDASSLGLLFVCMAIGSLAALPASGPVVHHLGAARTVAGGAVMETAGLLLGALGVGLGSVAVTGLGLVVMGFGNSLWDVAMNVEAADTERRLGRTVMPRFHAGWSVGSVAGAGLGALCASFGVGVTPQLVATAAIIMPIVVLAVRSFRPVEEPSADSRSAGSKSSLLEAWRDRRTLTVGLMMLSFAFTEGVANDWLAVTLVEDFDSSETVGAMGFGVFVVAMTASRLIGGSATDRWGRVAVLRGTALLAASGVALVILAPLAWAFVGAFLWGMGAALGFPVGMSAAADDSTRAALHVSVVGSIGYTAFLAGPPLVGFLGDAVGIRDALYVVMVALVLAFMTAGATHRVASLSQGTDRPATDLTNKSA